MRAAALLILASIGCSNAGGQVSGGDVVFDAAAAPAPDAGLPACNIDGEAGAPITWGSLYTDYFGPTGAGTCTKEPGNCHGGTEEPGFKGSGYMCTTKDACRESLTADGTGASHLVQIPRDAADPSKSGLVLQLRRLNAKGALTGSMPKRPSNCIFESSALERVQAWIDAGAPNN